MQMPAPMGKTEYPATGEPRGQEFSRQIVIGGLRVTDDPEVFQFSFSSETPVQRYFGVEVLSHDPAAPDYTRINGGAAPYIWDHDKTVILGTTQKAWIGDDRRGYCEVRWSPVTQMEGTVEAKRRIEIESGICRSVSFAYTIDDLIEKDNGFLVTRYTVLEVSSVPIPADPTVGMGRSMDAGETEVEQAIEEPDKTEETTEAEAEEEGSEINLTINIERESASGSPVTVMEQMTTDTLSLDEVRSAERDRANTIIAACEKRGVPALAAELVSSGATLEKAFEAIMDASGAQKQEFKGLAHSNDGSQIGLTDKEVRSFSFLKIARHLADPANRELREAAGFELECSRAAESQYGRSAKGVLVPNDLLTREQTTSTGSAGGFVVQTNMLSGNFIDVVRNRSAIMPYATTLAGLTGNVDIPRKTASSQVYWLGENVNTTETQVGLGQISMTPKTLGAFTDITRRLLIQSSLDAEMMVRSDLATSVALEMDRAGMYGTGSNGEPLGIRNITGVNAVTFTGGVTKTINSVSYDFGTYGQYIDMETQVATSNLDSGSMRYLLGAQARGALKQQPKLGSTFPEYVFGNDARVNGYETTISNQLVGSNAFFGAFENAVYGLWSGLDITVDPYSQSQKGALRIVAFQDVDFAVRYPAAFTFAAS